MTYRRIYTITELNRRTQIILAHLEEINAHERIDLEEYLIMLTTLFYECRNTYLNSGCDELQARELAMDDIKTYIISDKEDLKDRFEFEYLFKKEDDLEDEKEDEFERLYQEKKKYDEEHVNGFEDPFRYGYEFGYRDEDENENEDEE